MNKVELLGYYGSDLVHAQSAWTSTSRDITEEKKARVGKLLKMLASEGHHTPFEFIGDDEITREQIDKGQRKHNKAKRILFKLLDQYIERWWD